MIEYNRGEVGRAAKKAGFVRDTYEKTLRLIEILKYINSDEDMQKHLVLKGGTAINLTIFDLPRLSVDIDLDFTPNLCLEEMEVCRKKIKEKLNMYMMEEGYQLSPSSRYSHSLDSMLYQSQNSGGNRDNIKLEINYSLRTHIFDPVMSLALPNLFDDAITVRTLHPIEIFSAKCNALLSRAAARDLYDFNNMIDKKIFKQCDYELLRKSITFYASISAETINKTFNTDAIDRMDFSKIRRNLFPVIQNKEYFDLEKRKASAKDFIRNLMILTDKEKEYLEKFEKKQFRPELLFSDENILKNISNHPMALWKTSH